MGSFSDITLLFRLGADSYPALRFPAMARASQPGLSYSLHVDTTPLGPASHVSTASWQCWTVGEIYRYRGKPCDTSTAAQSFLADLELDQEQPQSLAGRFTLVAHNTLTASWSVWTDRCGSIHLYYCSNPASPALGSNSHSVYECSKRQLDWSALAGFFRCGFFPFDRTHYTDVSILRPASRYDFSSNGQVLRHTPYWTWSHTPDARRSEADTQAEFGHLLTTAVRDQLRGRAASLPLSGGLDSRTLAAVLPAGSNVTAYSYGYSDDSIETAISRDVARAVNLPFHPFTIQPYLFDRLAEVQAALEGFQDVTQARQVYVSSFLSNTAPLVLAGHWGDVFCDDMGWTDPVDSREVVLRQALKKLNKPGHEWLLENICKPRLAPEDAIANLDSGFASELDRFSSIKDPDFRIKALKTDQWAFRWTLASLRAYQLGAFPVTPFLDPDVIDFFTTVPTYMVAGRRIQIEYLKRFHPALARVRWQVYNADLYEYRYFNSLLLPRRAWAKARRLLGGSRVLQRNWEAQFMAPGQWQRLEAALLGQNLPIHDFVSPASITTLLQTLSSVPSGANGYTVSMLLTFAGWLNNIHG